LGVEALAKNFTCLLKIHKMAALINDFGFYEISVDLFYSLSFGIYSNFLTSVQQI